MAIKSLDILVVIVLVVATASISSYSSAVDVANGHFVALDRNNPYVVKLAKFAIDESKIASLHLDHVLEAAYKKESGERSYGLIIAARGSGGVANYTAELVVRGNVKEVVGFRRRPY